MTSLSYALPGDDGRALVRAFFEALSTANPGDPASTRRTWLDTFDARLQRAGAAVEYLTVAGRHLLRVWPGADDVVPVEIPLGAPPPTLARDFPHGAVWRRLARLVGVRALLPVAAKSGVLQSGVCHDRRGKTVLRLEAWWPGDGGAGRLDLLPVRGYPEASARAARVAAAHGLSPIDRGHAPPSTGASARASLPALDATTSAGEACRGLLARELAVMVENEPGMRDDLDPEFLHDYRVALRRTRAVLGECAAVVPAREGRRFRTGLRWLGSVTGPLRDADVHLLDLDGMRASLPARLHGDLDAFEAHLSVDRRRQRARLERALRTKRYRSLLGSWSAFLEDETRWGLTADAVAPITALVADRIRRCARRVQRDGRAIGRDSPDIALHELRKRCKKLRYLIELFGPLYRKADVRAFVIALKSLQENLGEHQDMAVRSIILTDFLEGATDASSGTRAAAELLLAASDARRRAAHDAFQECFAGFDTKRERERLAAMLGIGRVGGTVPVIATYNIKGGVGKTAAAVNLAWLAARDGLRTLLWDLDPQGAASFYFRVRPKIKGGAEKLVHKPGIAARRIRGSDYPGLDILPADFSYRNMDLVLDGVKGSRRRLAGLLEPLREDYDLIVLDCAPSISLVSENVFRASDALLVPLVPTTLSLRTYEQLRRHLRDSMKVPPRLLAFFSMVDRRRGLHREVIAGWKARDAETLESFVPYSSGVEQMGLRRAPIGAWAPADRGARAFAVLWAELRVRLWAEPGPG